MSSNNLILSKSRLKRGLQCDKSLFFTLYRKDLEPKIDPATQLNFDEGNEVGERARTLYATGLLIDKKPWEREESAQDTNQAIQDGANTIFEASFLAGGLFARIDILTRASKLVGWQVIEVKKSAKLKEDHIEDLALQAIVLAEAGIKVDSFHIMHLNSKCIYPNLSNLFVIKNVTKEVADSLSELRDKIEKLQKVAEIGTEPKVAIGPHCDEPYTCAFHDHCWKEFPQPSVFDLPGVGPVGGWKIIKGSGKTRIQDLDENEFKGKTKIAIEVAKTGKRWVEPRGFQLAIKQWQWPLYFLDFETLAPAIPRYSGCSPYTEIPFQFSCHVWKSPSAKIEHFEYLHLDQTDPRPAVATALAKGFGSTGSVVAYNMSVERGILEDLAAFNSQHTVELMSIASRLVDPLPAFRNHVYDAKFFGSFSIKDVAPALIGEHLNYNQLTISDGMIARAIAEQLMRSLGSNDERARLRQALLEYCRQDTIAMVELTKWMLDISKAA